MQLTRAARYGIHDLRRVSRRLTGVYHMAQILKDTCAALAIVVAIGTGAAWLAIWSSAASTGSVCYYAVDASGGLYVAGQGSTVSGALDGAKLPSGTVNTYFADCE